MTTSEQKRIELIEKQMEQMASELKKMKEKSTNQFESLETDAMLVEAYN